ncbi:MAG: polyprenyl synthetase family protein [Desulfobacterales bacterium]|jgi:geranylgeranyl diphosphate synthase type II
MDQIILKFEESTQYVDSILHNCLRNEEPLLATLYESVNYSLQSGGKRVRPLFCFLVGELFGVRRDRLASLACAVEMIHTASLIMDDLPHMDNGRIRRGKPANHIIYGQDVAALASIGLLTRAYELIAEDKNLSNKNKAKLVHNLAMTVGFNGMVGGQFVDLKFSDATVDYSVLEYIHTHKTASLFMASGKGAATIGNANEEEHRAIEDYAKYLGFAFQVADDLKDITGSAETTGKDTKKDKGNFIKLLGVADSKAIIMRYAEKAGDVLGVFNGKCENLLALRDMLLKKSL